MERGDPLLIYRNAMRQTVNRLLGYEESFWPQGLWRVSDDRPTDRVVRKFDI